VDETRRINNIRIRVTYGTTSYVLSPVTPLLLTVLSITFRPYPLLFVSLLSYQLILFYHSTQSTYIKLKKKRERENTSPLQKIRPGSFDLGNPILHTSSNRGCTPRELIQRCVQPEGHHSLWVIRRWRHIQSTPPTEILSFYSTEKCRVSNKCAFKKDKARFKNC
jgi:hypothetical protein